MARPISREARYIFASFSESPKSWSSLSIKESLKDLKADGTIYVRYSFDALAALYTKSEVQDYSARREESGINLKLVYTKNEGKLAKETLGKNSERGYLPPERFSLETDFFIFGDKVALMALSGKIFGVIIQSSAIASSMKKIFNLLWELTEKE